MNGPCISCKTLFQSDRFDIIVREVHNFATNRTHWTISTLSGDEGAMLYRDFDSLNFDFTVMMAQFGSNATLPAVAAN